MNNLKILAAFAAGAASGAILGILFAPGKGSDTRKKVLNSAKDLSTDLNSNIRAGVANARAAHDAHKELTGS